MNSNKGFTFIEIMVAISILVIFSAIVLGMLSSAKKRSNDASAITSMNQARAGAEVAYSNNSSSYTNMCPTISSTDPKGNVGAAGTNAQELHDSLFNAQKAISGTLTGTPTVTTPGFVGCGSTANAYALWIKLNNSGAYCLDSTGFAGVKSGAQTAGETVCS